LRKVAPWSPRNLTQKRRGKTIIRLEKVKTAATKCQTSKRISKSCRREKEMGREEKIVPRNP